MQNVCAYDFKTKKGASYNLGDSNGISFSLSEAYTLFITCRRTSKK